MECSTGGKPACHLYDMARLKSSIKCCLMEVGKVTRSSLLGQASKKALSRWFISAPRPCGKEETSTELREMLLAQEEDGEHTAILEKAFGTDAAWLNHESGALCWVRTLAAQHATWD